MSVVTGYSRIVLTKYAVVMKVWETMTLNVKSLGSRSSETKEKKLGVPIISLHLGPVYLVLTGISENRHSDRLHPLQERRIAKRPGYNQEIASRRQARSV